MMTVLATKRVTNKSGLSFVAAVFMLIGLWTADAAAQTRWSVSFDLGAQAPVSGDVHSGGSGRVLGLATQVESRSYGDVYGLSGTGLETINDESRRWSMPVTGGATVRF